jgi:hypothetical protein
MATRAFLKDSLSGGKVVPTDDTFAAGQETIRQVAADEPGRAAGEDVLQG